MAKRKTRWMQKVNRAIKRRGTEGAFRRWCQRHGYSKVTMECINEAIRIAKKTGNTTLLRRAVLARTYLKHRPKK